MPFNLGVGEIFLIAAVLGGVAAVVYGVIKYMGRSALGDNVSRQELQQEKRDLERRIEALEEREQLPRG